MKILIKTYWVLTLLLFFTISSKASARHDHFDQVLKHLDFDMKWKINNSKENKFIILDCQSFFQKFDFFENNNLGYENFITIQECEFFYNKFNRCIKEEKSVCVNSEDLYLNSCEC